MFLWAMFRSMAEYQDHARGGKDEGHLKGETMQPLHQEVEKMKAPKR